MLKIWFFPQTFQSLCLKKRKKCLNFGFLGYFQCFLLGFCFPCDILYFPLRKSASCSRYTNCHSCNLEFLSDLGLDNIFALFWSLSTYYIAQFTSHFKLKLDRSIHTLPDFCLIMAKCFWRTGSIWPVDCEFDPRTKHWFALVCWFTFCFFFLKVLTIHLQFPWAYYIVLGCNWSTFLSNTNFHYYRLPIIFYSAVFN